MTHISIELQRDSDYNYHLWKYVVISFYVDQGMYQSLIILIIEGYKEGLAQFPTDNKNHWVLVINGSNYLGYDSYRMYKGTSDVELEHLKQR